MINYQKNLDWSAPELAELKRRLMRRVYAVWFLRKVFVPGVLVLPLAGWLVWQGLWKFNLGIILENTLARLGALDFSGLWKYFFVALRETEHDALLILLSASLLLAFFARKLVRDVNLLWTRQVRLVK